ncbi:unnamed protein product [Pleuronectes platessa]|uniref:Uncharacterized protein n=1 Tax=Pleuronectes platessa TaxID=8262 RepID=A0A9N7YFD9_PLEPL|nr:unnamed protein product [Pleuronectes platessa]
MTSRWYNKKPRSLTGIKPVSLQLQSLPTTTPPDFSCTHPPLQPLLTTADTRIPRRRLPRAELPRATGCKVIVTVHEWHRETEAGDMFHWLHRGSHFILV